MCADEHIPYEEALKKAAALCGNREICSSHMLSKLKGWKVTEADSARIITRLKEEKFLDDQRFANMYIRDKYRLNGWGKIKLTQMLRQKKIPEPVIKRALEQIDPEHYYQTCERLISEKSSMLNEANPYKRKGKLFMYAAQRGFESDLIHRILSYL
jgi:regulatory protein